MKHFIPLLAFLVLITACSDNPSGPFVRWTNNSPGVSQPVARLENIWPNEDQTRWTFDYRWVEDSSWSMVTYPDSADVPPLPDWEEISELLDMRFVADSVQSLRATYWMGFNGQKTAGGGVTAQNLEDGFVFAGLGRALPAGARPVESPLIRRLRIARPDLARELPAAAGAPVEDIRVAAREPLLIHGGVWEKTSQWIGTYGDVDTLLAWKFLTDDLEPGSEFSHQLIPSFSDDVYLHGRIVRELTVRTPLGTIENAIECLYLVDLGVGPVFDPGGQPGAYARPIIYGSVVYAPRIGPVSCHERPLADTTDLIGVADIEMTVEEFEPPRN